jgi:hypothetical protein
LVEHAFVSLEQLPYDRIHHSRFPVSATFEDELAVDLLPDREAILADFFEAVPPIQALRALVPAPHAHVDRLALLPLEPPESGIEKLRAEPVLLKLGEHVKAVDLARARLKFRHR